LRLFSASHGAPVTRQTTLDWEDPLTTVHLITGILACSRMKVGETFYEDNSEEANIVEKGG